jgi:hypothetical protein
MTAANGQQITTAAAVVVVVVVVVVLVKAVGMLEQIMARRSGQADH